MLLSDFFSADHFSRTAAARLWSRINFFRVFSVSTSRPVLSPQRWSFFPLRRRRREPRTRIYSIMATIFLLTHPQMLLHPSNLLNPDEKYRDRMFRMCAFLGASEGRMFRMCAFLGASEGRCSGCAPFSGLRKVGVPDGTAEGRAFSEPSRERQLPRQTTSAARRRKLSSSGRLWI